MDVFDPFVDAGLSCWDVDGVMQDILKVLVLLDPPTSNAITPVTLEWLDSNICLLRVRFGFGFRFRHRL
jgi:hypothetical protein